MKELLIPQPSEKQREFLMDRHKYVGYGGARGGGKSWALRIKAVLLCLNYPGIKVMIVRKTYRELRGGQSASTVGSDPRQMTKEQREDLKKRIYEAKAQGRKLPYGS